MKRLISAFIALACASAFGATLNPIQLLNPTGSTSGQAILSTGASSAPTWGGISAASLTGILPVANGGTNTSSPSGTALDNITGFAGTGFLKRTGAGAYSFIADPMPIANGGTGQASASGTTLDNITGFSGTGFLTRTGAGAYAFQSATNGITLGNLAQAAANTVLANGTGSTANITSLAMPSCSASGNNLQWTSGTGFTCATGYALLASPTFTGTPAAPTAAAGTSTTQIATTAFLTQPGPIGSVTANTGNFTTLSASSTVSGTGFSTYLASPPAIGGSAAAAGSFTTLSATSTITPSQTAGIVGTTTNNNANAGSIGEYVTNSTTANSLTNSTALTVASAALTAGDWDVECTIAYNPAGTTQSGIFRASVSTTNNTLNAGIGFENIYSIGNTTFVASPKISSPVVRESFASTTTVYCIAFSTFSVSTMTADGLLRARRVR